MTKEGGLGGGGCTRDRGDRGDGADARCSAGKSLGEHGERLCLIARSNLSLFLFPNLLPDAPRIQRISRVRVAVPVRREGEA